MMHFGITEKPTRDSMPYYVAGLISKVSKAYRSVSTCEHKC